MERTYTKTELIAAINLARLIYIDGELMDYTETSSVIEAHTNDQIISILNTDTAENTKRYTIASSHGSAEVCAKTGYIISIDESLNNEYKPVRFDIKELKEFRNKANPNEEQSSYIDILSIGYWDESGNYTPPEPDFRVIVKYEYNSIICGIIQYLEGGRLRINSAITDRTFEAEEMQEIANEYKSANRIHKPLGILFWIDCKNGKASNWINKQ